MARPRPARRDRDLGWAGTGRRKDLFYSRTTLRSDYISSRARRPRYTASSIARHYFPGFASCDEDMLDAFHCAHVLSALETAGIRATKLAHAAPHLLDRLVFMLLHPLQQALLDVPDVIDSVSQQRRTQHSDARPDHQQLENILSIMDAASRGQISFHSPV